MSNIDMENIKIVVKYIEDGNPLTPEIEEIQQKLLKSDKALTKLFYTIDEDLKVEIQKNPFEKKLPYILKNTYLFLKKYFWFTLSSFIFISWIFVQALDFV